MVYARQIPVLPRMLHAKALGRMYGDPARVTEGTLETYTDGMMIPGTVEHVLRIVAGWHEDMRLLRSELAKLVSKPALLVWGDRDRAVALPSGERLKAADADVEADGDSGSGTSHVRGEAGGL